MPLRIGVSRGVFTNEAGMGTAAMAHGSAQVDHPAEQGLMGIMEVFLDTVVICTLTALVILTSGVEIPFGTDAGAALTARALTAGLGIGFPVRLSVPVCLGHHSGLGAVCRTMCRIPVGRHELELVCPVPGERCDPWDCAEYWDHLGPVGADECSDGGSQFNCFDRSAAGASAADHRIYQDAASCRWRYL